MVAGLALTGGGARAAYQVGALKALGRVLRGVRTPFPVLAGASAGAINVTALAVGADRFRMAVRRLEAAWLSLTPDQVFRTDLPSLATIGARWLSTVAGGTAHPLAINHLLDTAPLRKLLARVLDLSRLPHHIRTGALRGLALSATNYQTGTAVTFFDGAADIQPWARSTRIGRRESLGTEHVMASTAIPVFFPPVALGGSHFGDGCVRLTTPLSPAIHLGADRIVTISVRYFRTEAETRALNERPLPGGPTLAEISGVLLNSVFLDALEADVERLERINRTLSLVPEVSLREVPHALRHIPILVLRPSRDLGSLAADLEWRLPRLLRYLLAGLGAERGRGADLLSYLAFEREYVGRLIALGEADTLARADEIRAFMG